MKNIEEIAPSKKELENSFPQCPRCNNDIMGCLCSYRINNNKKYLEKQSKEHLDNLRGNK